MGKKYFFNANDGNGFYSNFNSKVALKNSFTHTARMRFMNGSGEGGAHVGKGFWLSPSRQSERINYLESSDLAATPYRILIPIDASVKSTWGIQYAMLLHREGIPIEVTLLNIGESIMQWHAIKPKIWQKEINFLDERAQSIIKEVAQQLAAEGIPFRELFEPGNIVHTIADVVAKYRCSEVILPKSKKWLFNSFTQKIVVAVKRLQHPVLVVVVDHTGLPQSAL